jgi:hypothetical protein
MDVLHSENKITDKACLSSRIRQDSKMCAPTALKVIAQRPVFRQFHPYFERIRLNARPSQNLNNAWMLNCDENANFPDKHIPICVVATFHSDLIRGTLGIALPRDETKRACPKNPSAQRPD